MITVQDEATPALKALKERLQKNLKAEAGPMGEDFIRYTVRTKFESGEPYLKRRSGRSILYLEGPKGTIDVRQQGPLTSVIVGSPLPGVRAHEVGLDQVFDVPAYRRRAKTAEQKRRRRHLGGLVGAHRIRVHLRGRHMFRDSLIEWQPNIEADVNRITAESIAEVV